MSRKIKQTIQIHNDDRDKLINDIIDMEWDMFDKVSNLGGRAKCQDDEWTFYAMRYSQHSAANREFLIFYKFDLAVAAVTDRNLIMEKYAYMIEKTKPVKFQLELESYVTPVPEHIKSKAWEISEIITEMQVEFAERYPVFSSKGRPIKGNDMLNVSFEVYLQGELKTYSMRSLEILHEHILSERRAGRNYIENIYNSLVKFYNYKDVEEYEMKNQRPNLHVL